MKKLTVLSLILLVALVVLGLGYARWTETLNINGTVNTGRLDAELSEGDCWDSEPEGKDFSKITCQLDPNNSKKLLVTVSNAYPSIKYYCEFDVHNTGTIPLDIDKVSVDRGDLPDEATLVVTGIQPGVQIHPCERKIGKIYLHLGNDAEEEMTYNFSITIDVGQWNE